MLRCRVSAARPRALPSLVISPALRRAPRFSLSQSNQSSPSPAPSTASIPVPPRKSERPGKDSVKLPKSEGPASKMSAKEQLKEFEDAMMQYLQATAPSGKDGKDGKKTTNEKQADPDEALLDAATEALIRKKEEEFKRINFWDAFMAPELRHNFIIVLLLALIIGLCLKILRLKGEVLDSQRSFAAERLEMQEQALRAAQPSGVADQEAQADEVLARVQVLTGLSDPKDVRLLRQQVLSAIRFTRAPANIESVTVAPAPIVN